ncbi:helix-turn-helix domain-containing protein [Dermatophilaceae bacterium Sec6.4]
MSESQTFPEPSSHYAPLQFAPEVSAWLQAQLPTFAEKCVDQIFVEVPEYARTPSGELRGVIEAAVQAALGGFLRMATARQKGDPTPHAYALDGAYRLGSGEAHSGRPMDALLSAYRIGARVAWREMSTAAVAAGLDAATTAQFAELVFTYIDELTASSVEGHATALAQQDRTTERRRERVASALIAGRSEEVVRELAARADWAPPRRLTAVVLPSIRLGPLLSGLGPNTLRAAEEPGYTEGSERTVLLVADRRRALRLLADREAYVGPARPWLEVAASYERAVRAMNVGLGIGGGRLIDTEDHLADLVLASAPTELADLRTQVLAPLGDPGSSSYERHVETLRSWLLHQGRRDEVAAELHVHAQTVRYRMGQIRELYGERLTDPDTVMALLIALHPSPSVSPSGLRSGAK